MTLYYILVPELHDYMDVTPLDSMLCAMTCTMMQVIRHASGKLNYKDDIINFAQDFKGFFGATNITQASGNTPCVVLTKWGVQPEEVI